MIFRNLTAFVFPTSTRFYDLEEQLTQCTLKPVGPLEPCSRGFIAPIASAAGVLAHRTQASNVIGIWITLGGEDRILPASVINDHLHKRIAEFEAKNSRKPGGKMRRQLKDEVTAELMPRAFVRPMRTDALLLPELGMLVVDTASRKAAEAVVSALRQALGSFPALPLSAQIAPHAVLTGWVAGDPLPAGITLGESCVLRSASDRARVRISDMELYGEEIASHLEAGKQCSRLALALDDRLSFTLDEDLTVRRLRLLDGALDKLQISESEDVTNELLARLVLLTGEVVQLYCTLQRVLAFNAAE